ncbi:transcription termination factor 4, mitochondrial [Eucyclogobius newberryi]|uniref:transcription termination factor 4, mitochondrial n=1 Tax=Eucyclogobius newberryi TaxID=166745 RepID=UPI003B590572
MGFPFAVRQLGWIARYTSHHLTASVLCGRCHQPALCLARRHRSSTADNTPQNQEPKLELSVRLLDMGFTDTQAEHIYDTVGKSGGERMAKHTLSTLSALIVLGLNPSSVLKLLEKCPELYTVKEAQLRERITNLRKLGLLEGSLQRVVAHHPQILTLKIKKLNSIVMFLKEKCLFTTQQVTDILRDSPAIIQDDLAQIQYKFQYVYFRMGVKQTEMVKSRLFRFTLDEVRNRHCFLERRGLYETPDKKGQTTIVNPKLGNILNVDQDMFVTQGAKATPEEFDVFQRLMAREYHEEEQLLDLDRISGGDDDDDDNDDDDVEEEDGNKGKMGYMKRKKKLL